MPTSDRTRRPSVPTRAADVIVTARRRAGMTQHQLADRALVPQSMVSAYERGRREPTLPTLARLVGATGFRLELELVPWGVDLARNGCVLREVLSVVDRVPASGRPPSVRFPRLPDVQSV